MDVSPTIVFHPNYDIRFGGMEKLHPFDSCKYGRAWETLKLRYGDPLLTYQRQPAAPISDADLAQVHSESYLQSLHKSKNVAKALELPLLGYLPFAMLNKSIITPMRYAAAGTVLASQQALLHGVSVNLSGGYHHASQSRGEGFCLFADVGVAVLELRQQGLLAADDVVLIIDLDAHQGNGNEHVFRDDNRISIFDMYNKDIYPADVYARERIDMDVPVISGTADDVYLSLLQEKLPVFLTRSRPPALAFYIAGTDILAKDPLGALNVSAQGVLARDRYVFEALLQSRIPFVMLPSGGYTQTSYRLIADSVGYLLERCTGLRQLH